MAWHDKLKGLFPKQEKAYQTVGNNGWNYRINEPFTGAWERNQELNHDTMMTQDVIFACITLMASDISKLPIETRKMNEDRIPRWSNSPAFRTVLNKPNDYQTRQQFLEKWVLSKLSYGNTYVLKHYDNRNTVDSLHILDPNKVTPVVTDKGEVYYQVRGDRMNPDLPGYVMDDGSRYIPANMIIHDRFNCLYHPLVGVSPIVACALNASTGYRIQQHAEKAFKNNLRPGGLLTIPGHLEQEKADALNSAWEEKFSKKGGGGLAILSDGSQYTAINGVSPVDAEMASMLSLSNESVCRVFHMPGFLVGVGTEPAYSGIESRTKSYFTQTLQGLTESIETLLEEGLGAGQYSDSGVMFKFNTETMFRMDSKSQMDLLVQAVGGGIMKPDEARRRLDLDAVEGGDSVYLQQQNYSLEALAKRDAQEDPFNTSSPEPVQEVEETEAEEVERALSLFKTKGEPND